MKKYTCYCCHRYSRKKKDFLKKTIYGSSYYICPYCGFHNGPNIFKKKLLTKKNVKCKV